MVSVGGIVLGLAFGAAGLLARLIGAELALYGARVFRDGYRALRWNDTEIADGFVKTTTTLRGGDGNNGFFFKQGPLVYSEAPKRNWLNLLRKTKSTENEIVTLPAISGAIVERNLQRVALAQPRDEGRFDILTETWDFNEQYADADEMPENLRRGLFDLDEHAKGLLSSVTVSEYRATAGDTIRLLGMGSLDGVSAPKDFQPTSRFLLGINVSWRRMARNRFLEGFTVFVFGIASWSSQELSFR